MRSFTKRPKQPECSRHRGGVFEVIITAAQYLLPDINQVPDEFPATSLWLTRMSALGMQAIMWTSLGLLFGWLAERSLRTQH
jgi:Probable cobalt transporter subunit (CbtA)